MDSAKRGRWIRALSPVGAGLAVWVLLMSPAGPPLVVTDPISPAPTTTFLETLSDEPAPRWSTRFEPATLEGPLSSRRPTLRLGRFDLTLDLGLN